MEGSICGGKRGRKVGRVHLGGLKGGRFDAHFGKSSIRAAKAADLVCDTLGPIK